MPAAARITDMHTSPSSLGIPAPILPPGCITVVIGGLPAARATDPVTVSVPAPDAIAKGSGTVFIGGLPAARMGDQTGSGGAITTGFPTVMIGG